MLDTKVACKPRSPQQGLHAEHMVLGGAMKIYAKVDGQHYEFERPEIDSRGFVINSIAKYCPLCLAGWAHCTGVIENLAVGVGPRMKGYHSVAGQLCTRCGQTEHWRHPERTVQAIPGSLLEEPQTNCQT